MKKFSFRLQTILEMREKKLEDERKEMAIVVARLNEQQEILNNIKKRQSDIKNNLSHFYSEDNECMDILEVVNYKEFYGKLLTDEKKQEALVEQFKNVLAAKQKQVTEALKQVKILEKLKETQEKKFYDKIQELQAKELDDIASTRYVKAMV